MADVNKNAVLESMAIGKTPAQAEEILEEYDCYIRVAQKDGESFLFIGEWDPQRMNVETQNGKITRVLHWG